MIAFGKIIDELRRLGREYPDRVAQCSLFAADGKTPVCIVGHAFVNVGVEVEMEEGTHPGEDANLITPTGRVVGHSSETIDVMQFKNLGLRQPTEKQLHWAFEVQNAQDAGFSWGRAVASADYEMRELAEAGAR